MSTENSQRLPILDPNQVLIIDDITVAATCELPEGLQFTTEMEELYQEIYKNVSEFDTEYPQTIKNYIMMNNLDIDEAHELLSDLNILYLDYLPNPRLHIEGFVDYGYTYGTNNQGEPTIVQISDFILTQRGEALLDKIFAKYPVAQQQPLI